MRFIGVDAGQRAAAGADLDHLDHGDAHRQAAALHEAVAAVDLEAARGHRLAVVDDADLGGRAAHVEGQDAVDAHVLGDPGRQDHAARRARFDEADREAHRRLERGEAAARGHQQQRAGEARRMRRGSAGSRDSAPSAAGHRRWRRSSRSARTRAPRGRPRRRWRCARRAASRPGSRPCAARARDWRSCAGSRWRSPRRPSAFSVSASASTAASSSASRTPPLASVRSGTVKRKRARHQRLGLLDEDVVLLEAVLLRHLDRIAEALGGDQRGLRALALDDGVGGERRAVHDQADLAGLDLAELQRPQHAVEHAVLGRGLGRQHLGREARVGRLQHDVGEGSADVDREADRTQAKWQAA